MSLSNAGEMQKIGCPSKILQFVISSLPKTFHCFDHELLVAKLNAYKFIFLVLKLIHNYFSDGKQI